MDKVLYTLGYGIIKGTHREKRNKFVKRLEYIQRGVGMRLFVVDIRKAGCGSRNGPHFSQGAGMLQMVRKLSGKPGRELEETITYVTEPHLANKYGASAKALKAYAVRLELAVEYLDEDLTDMSAAFYYVAQLARRRNRAIVLLCGCKDAYKANGTTWNCHRVPLGEALVKKLGDGWDVCHL